MSRNLVIFTVLFLLILAGVNFFFITRTSSEDQSLVSEKLLSPIGPLFNLAQAYVFPLSEPSYLPILDAGVVPPTIQAKSALIFDIRSERQLFSKNVTAQLPIASLTKLMTAVVILEHLNQGEIVTITAQDLKVDGERQDLFIDERISVGNLLQLMLVESSNDAAYALSNFAKTRGIDTVAVMNEKAREWGMLQTKFLDPAGLNDEGYSTARDLARLARYALRYREIWDALRETEVTVTSDDGKIIHKAQNTNDLLGVVPNVIGGKTGFTDKAGGCLILLVDIPGYRDTIVSIIVGSPDRFADTEKLVTWVREAYRWE